MTAELKEYFEREFPNPSGDALTMTTNLLEDWFIDSLSIVQTAMHLEQSFGVQVQRADITAEHFENIETLSDYVIKSLKQG